MTARPETPDPVKRVLRQEACFGCCACGNPIFQYQHIIEYATDPHFRPEDMMVLCPEHHNQATQRVLDEAVQRAMKAKPFNCERRLASGQLSVRQRTTDVDLGGHRFAATAVLVAVDGEPLLTTGVSQFGTLLLGLRLHDRDDNLVAHVVENEWVSEDPLPWDIEFAYRRLTIRSAPRQIELNIDAGVEPVRIRGSLWRKGQHILIDNEGLHAGGAHLVAGL